MSNRLDPHDAVEWAAMAVELAQSTTAESRRLIGSSRATRATSRQIRAALRTQRHSRHLLAAGLPNQSAAEPDRRPTYWFGAYASQRAEWHAPNR